MAILRAIADSVGGTLADQWEEIVTAGEFDEQTVVAPGVLKRADNGRGSNYYGSENVLSRGSVIYVPENTAAFVFNQSGIEEVVTEPGGYEYLGGQESIFNDDSFMGSVVNQTIERVRFGGVTPDQQLVAFVNLREIRGIKFGTRGPVIYHDRYYGTDLEVYSYGSFTVKVEDPVLFVRNFVPANTSYYTFADRKVRSQLLSEFLQSFITALNALSTTYRISELPAQATEIAEEVKADDKGAGTWPERFGFTIVSVGVESIELSDESRELVRNFASKRMDVRAYEDVSRDAADIAAQQRIAQGIQENGLGDAGGMIFGMNLAQGLDASARGPATDHSSTTQAQVLGLGDGEANGAAAGGTASGATKGQTLSIEEQVAAIKSLKELLDAGILTQEEFDAKKKEILGL